jgi:hypothetical protein
LLPECLVAPGTVLHEGEVWGATRATITGTILAKRVRLSKRVRAHAARFCKNTQPFELSPGCRNIHDGRRNNG